jgi:hypothetical protein
MDKLNSIFDERNKVILLKKIYLKIFILTFINFKFYVGNQSTIS